MTGPACDVRSRIATPHAHSPPRRSRSARAGRAPARSTPLAADVHPDREGDDRQERRRRRPADEGGDRVAERRSRVRFGAASSSRRANPVSKSRAIPKPVKTPPNAADWQQDEHELERRVADREVEAGDAPDAREPARERGEEEEREDERREEERRGGEDVRAACARPRPRRRGQTRVTSAPASAGARAPRARATTIREQRPRSRSRARAPGRPSP